MGEFLTQQPVASSLKSPEAGGYIQAKSCANCHSAVHGSNHPAGLKRHR